MEKVKMSQERLDQITKEVDYLETVRTKEVAEMLKEARSYGDLSENSEYDAAKDEQGKLYSRIDELKALIENAEVVEEKEEDIPKDVVTLGSVVKLFDIEEDEELEYVIVGSQEANPKEGKISDDCPLGRALKGHRAGDDISYDAGFGVQKFQVISVENN